MNNKHVFGLVSALNERTYIKTYFWISELTGEIVSPPFADYTEAMVYKEKHIQLMVDLVNEKTKVEISGTQETP